MISTARYAIYFYWGIENCTQQVVYIYILVYIERYEISVDSRYYRVTAEITQGTFN